jgi:hypothetical protein
MSDLRKAAEQALAFLSRVHHWEEGQPDLHAIKVQLRAALAEPEQSEPVAAIHIGWDYLDNGKMVATYAVPVNEQVAPRLYAASPRREPPPWCKDDLDGMVEAFNRVIEDHHDRSNPFHDPINADAMTALRFLRGYLPYMKAHGIGGKT